MNEYVVYFELFGKKMRTTVWATDADTAKYQIMNRIIFHKVVSKEEKDFGDFLDSFLNGFGIKKS